jgi:uncharacterized protein
MTNEERDIIASFIARVAGAGPQSPWAGASVPATTPALPPVDREADGFIADQFQRYPEARYRLTQLAFVQEHALAEAQNRLRRLESELQQAQQAAQQTHGQGGFLGGLFGGGRSQPPPQQASGAWGRQGGGPGYQPPPSAAQYPPGYNAGMFQRQGSGFLGSALTTAAGVAGGVLAADAIRDMFSGPREAFGAGPSPWASEPGAAQPDQGYVDTGTWDQGTDQTAWNDPGNDPSGGAGWDQGGDPGLDPGGSGGDDDSLI